ncbi:SDR family NAD(P)-dependent oxidoreductase [Flavisphingomonas formosensis]|uniref:SDR family NAD(P)-dependent oxidoreductase n=1 Tax=Flavisphingomonas formosensis TaxID=861534 RepID=UPI0018DF1679|nr:SDR family NAD(P)-dependent oxidoreductase [Sphingomonas formosensis]
MSEAIWRLASDPASPFRVAAGADAEAWMAEASEASLTVNWPALREYCMAGKATPLNGAPVSLVTGANRGIGLETVRRLVGAGHHVFLAARDTERGPAAAEAVEGYSLGGQVTLGTTTGWLLTPPTSQDAENQLVRDSLALEKTDPAHEKYHGIFLSHTGVDNPFVRQLRKDLLAHGVERVWLDEAEIDIGDSLIAKIEEGMKLSRYIAVVLSKRSMGRLG